MARTDAVDLTNCDREPIHVPGSIQPHGFLLACDPQATVVQRYSGNAAAALGALGLEQVDLNGQRLESLVGRGAAHSIRNALARSNDPARPSLIAGLRLDDPKASFDVAMHQYKNTAILEFEPAAAGLAASPLELARALVTRLRKVNERSVLLDNAARLIRGLLGYDRVMVYRFAHDGSGQVVSEAKQPDLEPFLDLHYPASDIPRQARELYLKNTIRIIPDIEAAPVPIAPPLSSSGEPLDLSYAHLRSVSPIHCEYLRNMGVVASMSVSIIVGGNLWGLIACHHYSPRALSMVERIAAEMFGEFFSLHLEALEHKRMLDAATHARHSVDKLIKQLAQEADLGQVLQSSLKDLRRLLPCDGVALWIDGEWTTSGSVAPPEAISDLNGFLNGLVRGQVWATHALSDQLPSAAAYAAQASGVLAIPLSQTPRDYLLFFRKEVAQTVAWGGNPEKQYETGPFGDRLTPRKSFAIWKETVERQSQPWTDSDFDIAETARIALLEVVLRHTEILEEERNKSVQRQATLNQELNHRVKNILALIKSLISMGPEEGGSVGDYVESLKGRIQALAYAHDQVVRGAGALRDLIEAELQPYRGGTRAFTIEGPEVGLQGRAYTVMALVIHELATNAVKYGALSAQDGRLAVRWSVRPDGDCEINWQESGGPEVRAPSRHGFGSRLVDRAVAFDLGGASEVDYASSGVTAAFVVPAKFTTPIQPPSPVAPKVDAPPPPPTKVLNGLKVLLVEDQFIVAMDAETMLLELGAVEVKTAATVADALQLIATFLPDAAVLDVNLGEATSLEVAEELVRRQIPIVFATGYEETQIASEAITSAAIVHKPIDSTALAQALSKALTQARR